MKLKGKPLWADRGPGIFTKRRKFTIAGFCLSRDFAEVNKDELVW